MAFIVDEKGDITLVQGDSGIYSIKGLPTDKNYTVHFEIKDENRKTIGEQITINSNYSNFVDFVLTGDFTDLLKVKKDEDTAEYYFGIKLCSDIPPREDTLLINDKQIGENNIITVYPKKAEGI